MNWENELVKTLSSMLPLGTKAPAFSLIDVVSGKTINLNDGHEYFATLIMFICNHCPYVKHINSGLAKLSTDYKAKNIRIIAINSNNIENHPDDSPDNMKIIAKTEGYQFPYLFDETQEVAKAYHAACTPDFFVFDKYHILEYRGQFDDSRPGNGIDLTGSSIRTALDCLITGKPIPEIQKPSIGCNIKWK